jgi:superfamily II helicase
MSATILRFREAGQPHLATPEDFGRSVAVASTSLLNVPVEEMRLCTKCQSEQRFVADRDCAFGLVGTCMGCGDEWLRPFSRNHSEVVS